MRMVLVSWVLVVAALGPLGGWGPLQAARAHPAAVALDLRPSGWLSPAAAAMARLLGGIRFEGRRPEREIRVFSRAVESVAAVGAVPLLGRPWTTAERDRAIGRVLGRVIAHEIGHYLFGSTRHTTSGLMKAHHSPAEFVAPSRRPFRLSGVEESVLGAPAAQ
jgi:hypothetical protein